MTHCQKVYERGDSMTKDEALKLALEALEYASTGNRRPEIIGPAIIAIKEALAQPAQEPVACVQDLDEVKRKHLVYQKGMDWKDPLYTKPPQPEQEPLLALFDENQRLRAKLKFNTVQQQEPRNFCPRCGKHTADLTVIHTCTPPEGGHQ